MPANLRQASGVPTTLTAMGWKRPFLLFALLLTAGCSHSGPSYSLSPASGTVSIDGKPLANALVVFHSETSPAAAGKTDSNGKFELETGGHGAGIAAGDFLVQINSTPETTDSSGKAISIPIVYSENGVEVVKITDGGENSFTFELKSKPRKSDYISTNPLEPR